MKKYWWIISCCGVVLCSAPLPGRAQNEDTAPTLAGAHLRDEATGYPIFDMRTVPAPVVKALKEDKSLQYHDVKTAPPKNNWLTTLVVGIIAFLATFRYLILALLLGLVIYLIYRFMKSNGMNVFRKPLLAEPSVAGAEEALGSNKAYEDKIAAAMAVSDYRQAIRWWYLYTLFQLAGQQLIVTSREKTNNDHLHSMRNSPYYKKFAALTLDYEYIWYGGFEVSDSSFGQINEDFKDFNNEIVKAS
ncbi:hypothetical protein ACDQ55_07400 [Chitinophaga sp. 30R24]|uniref:hypothetical protein n=1 Tax=Chitinophaga sp. 30R24 TaxID=3248838 RepID=UPI003B8FACC9